MNRAYIISCKNKWIHVKCPHGPVDGGGSKMSLSCFIEPTPCLTFWLGSLPKCRNARVSEASRKTSACVLVLCYFFLIWRVTLVCLFFNMLLDPRTRWRGHAFFFYYFFFCIVEDVRKQIPTHPTPSLFLRNFIKDKLSSKLKLQV